MKSAIYSKQITKTSKANQKKKGIQNHQPTYKKA